MNTDKHGFGNVEKSSLVVGQASSRAVSLYSICGSPWRLVPPASVSICVHPWLIYFVEKQKFKLVIAYDGTAYEGWQMQKIGTGVQQKVEEALAKLFPSRPTLTVPAARTPAFMRSAWSRILRCPAPNSK